MKRIARGDAGAFDHSVYTDWKKRYDSRDDALKDQGSNVRCKGHCARAVKKQGNVTFLKCRLPSSDPACTWAAVLREGHDGTTELLQHPTEWNGHNDESSLRGNRGFDSLVQRKTLAALVQTSATAKPTTALRTARLDHGLEDEAQLQQDQRLKDKMSKDRYGCKNLGQLREIIEKHHHVPTKAAKGYFCYTKVESPEGTKPTVTVVATTKALQQRSICLDSEARAIVGAVLLCPLTFLVRQLAFDQVPASNWQLPTGSR